LGAPIYYGKLGKRLFGNVIKYPLARFAGAPERLLRKHLYLDFTGHRRNPAGMKPFEGEILPGFHNVREKGLNLIDATQLHQLQSSIASSGAQSVSGD
jgi:hypothetical protein